MWVGYCLKERLMRLIPVLVTLTAVTPLLAQSSSSYRITHMYTLGGDSGCTISRNGGSASQAAAWADSAG